MHIAGWIQLAVFCAVVALLTKPVGRYLFRVFETPQPFGRFGARLETALLRLGGVTERREQTWQQYTLSLLALSVVSMLLTYFILRIQHLLPLNPDKLGPVPPELAFNTAASFTTNTNWQAYSGERTMSHLSQMAALVLHNFLSAGVGIGVALALARGLTRPPGPEGARRLGNFWVDLIRSLLYVLLPLSLVLAMVLVAQGVIQNFSPSLHLHTLEGGAQSIAMGPVATQEAIKELGTNGGGFFNANSAHPFENPTPLTNFIELVAILVIPAGLTHTYGRMAKDARQGWAIFAAMMFLFVAGAVTVSLAEGSKNTAVAAAGIEQPRGNLEGKEVRFGVPASALFAATTTAASCGAVNSMHDSYTPIGGLVPLVNIELGEVIFGGVGSGLYGMLVFVMLAVFLAGLMVGRTPEYLGKKIEAREMKLVMLYVLIFPLIILGLSGASAVLPFAASSVSNAGPHGLSEILYAYSSGTGNNGSAFAGLNANTRWWNMTLGLAMLGGRFLMIVPVLALAGGMVDKKVVPPSLGSFPTNGVLFTGLLISVVVIVGALTFFPALSLGPIVEQFVANAGRVF